MMFSYIYKINDHALMCYFCNIDINNMVPVKKKKKKKKDGLSPLFYLAPSYITVLFP